MSLTGNANLDVPQARGDGTLAQEISAGGAVLWNAGSVTALGGGIALSGGTIIATGTVGSVNLTSATGLLINGVSILNIDTTGPGGNTYIGVGSGNGTLTTGTLNTFVGYQAGQSNTSGSENVFLGNIAGQKITTGTFNTAIGEHALGYEDAASGMTMLGNDAGRNWVTVAGNGASTSVGTNSMKYGCGYQFTAVGQSAMFGNGGNVTITGTVTATDIINLTFTGTFAGSPHTVNVPLTGLTTTAQAAAACVTAINADSTLTPLNNGAVLSSVVQTLSGQASDANSLILFLAGSATTGVSVAVTSTITGAGTETVTITGGASGFNNVAIGQGAFPGYYLSSGNLNVGIGAGNLSKLTTGGQNVAIGGAAAPASAGYRLTTGSTNIYIGTSAGGNSTSGTSNVALGLNAFAANTIGNNHVAIGNGALSGYTGNSGGINAACIAIGPSALAAGGSVSSFGNIAVGGSAGKLITSASNNSLLGNNVASALTTGGTNTIIGANVASTTLSTGTGNILIGVSSAIDAATSAESNTFRLGNHATNTIRATGINTATPAFFLDWFPASTSYANDAAAAAGTPAVAVGQIYRNGSAMQIRVS